ncbi:ATP-binding protein [Sorangium sp. So ce1389]|uniref:ATP-binding protein n=1 Tax=Sorangium sp. So ce1389 TaxID=3133336 RepID=UPI003F5E2DF7
MLKLRRLRIEKFRSVAPGTEFRFSDGLNVVLGQNGTGKTTLLELISMVVRSDFSSLASEEFAIEYELAVPGEATVIVAISNTEQPNLPETKPGAPIGLPEHWHPAADITIEELSSGRRHHVRYDSELGLIIGDEQPTGHARELSCLQADFLWIYMLELPDFVTRSIFHRVRHASSARRFDESLELFTWLVGPGDARGRLIVHRDRKLTVEAKADVIRMPRALSRRLAEMYERSTSDYTFRHADLDFLAVIKETMRFDAAELKVDVTERRPWGEAHELVTLGNFVFRFWWEGGEFITHTRLSYGQKRLLTFFYYLACNDDIVIADELVNGLHHHWITACVEAIGERQAFLTSQNPLLLDYIPVTSPEQVHRSFVLCRGERRGGRPAWAWANMSDADAAEFFAAYEVGVEHVSEILQSRGLW